MSLAPPDLIRFAYLSLKGNPVRSLLSTIGVFMGVFAVSATLEARNIGQAYLAQQMGEREAPRAEIYYRIWEPNADRSFRLRPKDVNILRQELSGWLSISGTRWGGWDETVLFEGQEAPAEIEPVALGHLLTSGRTILHGRFFTESDFAKYRAVAVIDEWLATELFQGDTAVGKTIFANNNSYLVIGVVDTKEPIWSDEPSGIVMISMAMHTALTGIDTLNRILIRPTDIDDLEQMGEQAKTILAQENAGKSFDFWTNVRDIDEQRKTLRTVSIILLALGGVALTVGGVGIANITIASTIERTSEIGLRRALGATQREILVQFVLEAVVISCIGGVVAIATTQAIAIVVTQTFDLPYTFNPNTSAMALGSAVIVGVGSSFIPAFQASRLDPVNALRSS